MAGTERDDVGRGEILGGILAGSSERSGEYAVVKNYPHEMVLGTNIRDKNEEFVRRLAKSIIAQGQIQECTGDTLPDGRTRVWAGQHRFWAVEMINQLVKEHNIQNPDNILPLTKLRVRVWPIEFTEDQILEVQIAENLHEKMNPEDEAEAISAIYRLYEARIGGAASVADFARRVGLGESKVRNAVWFMGLEPKVREAVGRGVLLYSIAILLRRVPPEKQFPLATRAVTGNLDRESVEILIRQTLGDNGAIEMFTDLVRAQLDEQNFTIAYRNAADRVAKEASGYFKRILLLINRADYSERIKLTEPIRDILAMFIFEAQQFEKILMEIAPQVHQTLSVRVEELANQ